MPRFKTAIIAIFCVAAIAIAFNAFARGGMGYGGGWGQPGSGWQDRGGYGPCYDDQLSEEANRQIAENRAAFLTETESLRGELVEKERALQDELAKESPDVATASALQEEISALQAQLDQKRIAYMVEMRKANPNAGRGFRRGGRMMGYGGGGNCW
ncbi:MAG: periplasmic heavy metal sensor [Desulfosarcinaceae bacterium]|nr:periplasmic heavy metal sensor [Desulfosarcinaceae bacterium]